MPPWLPCMQRTLALAGKRLGLRDKKRRGCLKLEGSCVWLLSRPTSACDGATQGQGLLH